jgi:hypothetical protein
MNVCDVESLNNLIERMGLNDWYGSSYNRGN